MRRAKTRHIENVTTFPKWNKNGEYLNADVESGDVALYADINKLYRGPSVEIEIPDSLLDVHKRQNNF